MQNTDIDSFHTHSFPQIVGVGVNWGRSEFQGKEAIDPGDGLHSGGKSDDLGKRVSSGAVADMAHPE